MSGKMLRAGASPLKKSKYVAPLMAMGILAAEVADYQRRAVGASQHVQEQMFLLAKHSARQIDDIRKQFDLP